MTTAGPRRSAVAGLAVAAALLALGASVVPAPRAGAQVRRLVVVGDSTILGAQAQVQETFGGSGWEVVFDAAVSRSTLAGAEVVAARAAELTDTLVVGLGANDSGNPALFRQRIDAVMGAAGPGPRVLWLTIPEVRPYYGPANQVLRDAAAVHPNLRVVDWHTVAPQPGMTASDGLHLTPTGARAMALVLLAAASAVAEPVPPPTTAAPPPPPPTEAPPAPPVPADTVVPVPPPGTVPAEPSTTLATSTTTTTTDADRRAEAAARRRRAAELAAPDPGGSGGGGPSPTAALWVLGAALLLGVAGYAGHAVGTRVVRPSGGPGGDDRGGHADGDHGGAPDVPAQSGE